MMGSFISDMNNSVELMEKPVTNDQIFRIKSTISRELNQVKTMNEINQRHELFLSAANETTTNLSGATKAN